MVIPKAINADFKFAINVISDTVICLKSPEGFGNKLEINSDKNDKKYFEKEHNTIWYKITTKRNCILSFDIIPLEVKDDYDFILFGCQSGSDCNAVKQLKPLRSNISRNEKSTKSITGLSEKANDDFIGQGPGNSFSQPIKLDTKNSYYLILDNVYENGKGHKIIFHYSDCDAPIANDLSPSISINIFDKETHKPVTVKVLFIKKQLPDDDTLINNEGFLFIKNIEAGKYYELRISADSFLSFQDEFKVYPKDSMTIKNIELQKIAIGKKIIIDNIYFVGGSADFVHKSFPALKNLLFVMKENPKLEIEIQGHVNQPYNLTKKQNESYYQILSEARAMAVYDYLIKRGVETSRIKYKGFGYSLMKFPYAKTAEEMEQNRRVEIEILKM
ncbi:MAG: hypothetical protein AUJ98_01140 [Bacteroidetes bacterium CG2_30_33_31]|nr:MAG: hypothetical protein AUJ98_01140 [Bacteroidetes bacterium CG2_30_33_31]